MFLPPYAGFQTLPENKTRAKILVISFRILLFIILVKLAVYMSFMMAYGKGTDHSPMALIVQFLSNLLVSLFLTVNTIVFIVWMFRARKNLDYAPGLQIQYGAGWSIIVWLIPFANLVLPYLNSSEIWGKTQMAYETDPNAVRQPDTILQRWWVYYVIFVLSNGLAGFLYLKQFYLVSYFAGLISCLIGALAAVIAVRMVKQYGQLENQMHERAKQFNQEELFLLAKQYRESGNSSSSINHPMQQEEDFLSGAVMENKINAQWAIIAAYVLALSFAIPAFLNFYFMSQNKGVNIAEVFQTYSKKQADTLPYLWLFRFLSLIPLAIWSYTASKNLISVKGKRLSFAPWFTAISFFLPLVNLIFPPMSLGEISEYTPIAFREQEESNSKKDKAPLFCWLTIVVGAFFTSIGFFLEPPRDTMYFFQSTNFAVFNLFGCILLLIGFMMAAKIIRKTSIEETALFERVETKLFELEAKEAVKYP
jgi:Domain of unknown function (DUF4328)